ncbi:hypothetical protein [Bacteroides acidifaciens]|jgi:hypothetical protein|uniref:hypothetical protein n=2 Tax=Bacteroidia TaxID=200643 RepID=UPI00259B1ED8|nr:hypothetical protein [Bacteroides acidifaciens]
MRRIMNDRMYDTDKATLVVKYREELEDEPLFGSSFLYLKKTGEWFLYYEGGQYRDTQIKPIMSFEAKMWLAERDFVDEYIQYFGEPEE